MSRHLIDYEFYGDTYQIEIIADSVEEAQRRIFAIRGTARYAGELMLELPAPSLSFLKRHSMRKIFEAARNFTSIKKKEEI